MSAWTKGPLTVSQAKLDPRWANVHAPDGRVIADVWNVPGTKGAKALADANLFAAAWLLAEACDPETIEAAADEIGAEFKHTARAASLRAVAARMRAALAKARGEA